MKHEDDPHDHTLHWVGVDGGQPMFELECVHAPDDDGFYRDDEGVKHTLCLIQDWHSNDGFDIIDTGAEFTKGDRKLKLWTTWNMCSEPSLTGRLGFEYWCECL